MRLRRKRISEPYLSELSTPVSGSLPGLDCKVERRTGDNRTSGIPHGMTRAKANSSWDASQEAHTGSGLFMGARDEPTTAHPSC